METIKPFINEAVLLSEAAQDGIKKYAMGAFILNEEKQILLLRRQPHDFMGGLWELPSGTVDPGEGLEQALYREIKEETNLEIIDIVKYINSFDYGTDPKRTRQWHFLVKTRDHNVCLSDEHDQIAWYDKKNCHDLTIDETMLKVLNEFTDNTA